MSNHFDSLTADGAKAMLTRRVKTNGMADNLLQDWTSTNEVTQGKTR